MVKVNKFYELINKEKIPREWQVIELKQLTELITKGTSPSTYGYGFEESGINFLKVENISRQNKIKKETLDKISLDCHMKLSRSIFHEGDLAFSIAGTLGRLAKISKDILDLNTNQAIAIIRLKDKSLLNFLYYYLQSNLIGNVINNISTVGAQPNLSLKQLGDFPIILPSAQERIKICDILLAIDKQIDLTNLLLKKLRELKIGLLKKLLTQGVHKFNIERLNKGELPENWTTNTLDSLGKWVGGGTPSKNNPNYWSKEKAVLWVTSTDMHKNKISDTELYITEEGLKAKKLKLLPKGTLLFVTRSGILKKRLPVAIAQNELTINQDQKAFICNDKVEPLYIYYTIQAFNEQLRMTYVKTGTTVESVDFDGFKKYIVALPPKAEQNKIIDILSTIDIEIENYEKENSKYDQLKKGLMQQLLMSQIRVKVD